MTKRVVPHPFIKWAGGKSSVLNSILPLIPEKIDTYYEPFLGGGAVFFELSKSKRSNQAILNDANSDLINTYREIQKNVDELIRVLRSGPFLYDRDRYLEIRSQDTSKLSSVEQAARFIYLNKTCFNGLYRVNRAGHFNVPFGQYNNPVICDEVNLRSVSSALEKCEIIEQNFSSAVDGAKSGDVVYFDPPYFPLSKTSKFVGYTKDGFGLAEHTQLSIVFSQLAARGVITILSNSWCPTTLQLYRDFEVIELRGNRNVGGPALYRKSVREILVVANVPKEDNSKRSVTKSYCNM